MSNQENENCSTKATSKPELFEQELFASFAPQKDFYSTLAINKKSGTELPMPYVEVGHLFELGSFRFLYFIVSKIVKRDTLNVL